MNTYQLSVAQEYAQEVLSGYLSEQQAMEWLAGVRVNSEEFHELVRETKLVEVEYHG